MHGDQDPATYFKSENGPLRAHYDRTRYNDDMLQQFIDGTILRYRLATSSQHTYGHTWRHFVDFLIFYDVRNERGQILPACENQVLKFLAWCALRGVQSLDQYLSHVRTGLQQHGFPTDSLYGKIFPTFLRSTRRWQKEQGLIKPRPARLPFTLEMLQASLTLLEPKSPTDLRLLTSLTVGLFGMMRAGEFTISEHGEPFNRHLHATRENCTTGSTVATILLPASKTDRHGKGTTITLAHVPGSPLCPHCLLHQWLLSTSSTSAPHDHLFALHGKPYMKKAFTAEFRSLIKRLSKDTAHYTPHSLRIGGATLAALAGLPAAAIMDLGRWTTDCYQRYVKLDVNERARLARKLADASLRYKIDHSGLAEEHLATWGSQIIRP